MAPAARSDSITSVMTNDYSEGVSDEPKVTTVLNTKTPFSLADGPERWSVRIHARGGWD
jgi:hypothetical protein